jgi:uncharacterized protein (UPF0332 family)
MASPGDFQGKVLYAKTLFSIKFPHGKFYKQKSSFSGMKSDENANDSRQAGEIPGMNLENKYSDKKLPMQPADMDKLQKEMDKTKKELEKFRIYAVKKYPFLQAIGILPPQSIKLFIEEEEAPKETEKYMHLYVIVPEEKLKEMPKMKADMIKQLEPLKQKTWLHLKTPVDIWETCLDSKFELSGAIAMSFPLYDKDGILGALRVSEIHKSLVLQKFERYVVSYVLYGSFISRGKMSPNAEIDVGIIINDTDVKRMSRLELRERLRGIIYQYVSEALAMAGVKNTLHVQTWLLTEFWEAVKDAHPVMFTFIRDGVPIYDRGTFMPWKSLLKMGKLRPSPESIDMFMTTSEKTKEMAERRLADAMVDMYYGILNPSQALIMLYGAPPPTHKETPHLMEEIFVNKEKMLKKQEIAILDKIVKLFKKYEDDPKYKISGKEIDEISAETDKYIERLKQLRKEIEKRAQEKTVEQIYNDVFGLLKSITHKNAQQDIVREFENEFVKKGKFSPQHMRILNDIINVKMQYRKEKVNLHDVDNARKEAQMLINDLMEFTQRCELVSMERGRMRLRYGKAGKERNAELIISGGEGFLVEGNIIKKLAPKVHESNMKELTDAIERQKANRSIEINPKIFDALKREIGDYEIVL